MGDPFSTVLGSLQIAGQCAQVVKGLVKYVHQVRTVDDRIYCFYDDVTKLKSTYETLEQCRNSSQMVNAAKAADQYTDHLWKHLATTLKDCENTLLAINRILNEINGPLGLDGRIRKFLDRPLKQLREQLNTGELHRHQDKIRMFNTSLTLPMQMINITLQLNQKNLSEANQRRLENRLVEMQSTVDSLHTKISDLNESHSLRRTGTSGSSTIVETNTASSERAICDNMATFAKRAKQFLSNASTEASIKSGTSTVQLDNPSVLGSSSEIETPLTRKSKGRIVDWLPDTPEDVNSSGNDNDATPSPSTDEDEDDGSDDEDFELEMVRTYFEHGETALEKEDYAAAEENFIEALEVLQSNDFGERLGFQSADVVLMLAHCYVKQDKLDQAIERLLPLTEESDDDDAGSNNSRPVRNRSAPQNSARTPDRGRVLAAHHILGMVYLKQEKHNNAERHGLCAFRGRRRLLGKTHVRTVESVQLIVDVYEAMGKRARADNYRTHLIPEGRRTLGAPPTAVSELSHRLSVRPHGPLIVPGPELDDTRTINTTDSHATISPPLSTVDDNSTNTEFTRASLTSSIIANPSVSREYLKPRFDAIRSTAAASKDRAIAAAEHLLKGYEPAPHKLYTLYSREIRKNLKEQVVEKGLAATGCGYAPIHFFCELDTEAVTEVELLVEAGVNLMAVKYRAGYGKRNPVTPLQIALDMNHEKIATVILDALQKSGIPMTTILNLKDIEGLSPLLLACRKGQVETVTHFLRYGARVTDGFPQTWCGNSLLHDACSRCDVDMVTLLLSIRTERNRLRPDIGSLDQQDQFGRTPLMYAVISKNIRDQSKRDGKVRRRRRCVEALLRHGIADVPDLFTLLDSQLMDVIGYARDEGDQELLNLLMQHEGGQL